MSWTAVTPLKGGRSRKSRLAAVLGEADRTALSEAMAAHVLACLAACPRVGEVLLLSPEQPGGLGATWRRDGGGGLNVELSGLRKALPEADLLVVHADLPLLTAAEVDALLVAGSDVAIAPDRHGLGTNALALRRGTPFNFAFGPGSFALHRAQTAGAVVVDRPGLRLDVDTSEDLALARRAGFRPPMSEANP